LFVLLLFSFQFAAAQNKIITGKVTDSKGNSALQNVSIQAKGTETGTQTDASGAFKLVVPLSVTKIIISSVGYSSQEIDVSRNTGNLQIALIAFSAELGDVVVIGYGISRKKDLTGAVTRVTPKEFSTGIITNPLQQLQGRVAGLWIVQPGGDPNGDFTVRIRGATSLEGQPPLLVIDGVAIDDFNKAAATLNPADIETYDILKDAAAAAIYGSRGANGVILVTTKKGRPGKTLVEYNGFIGMEKISSQLDVLSADQWRVATAAMGGGGLDKGGNVDWQKEITQTGFSHSHTIGLSGGSNLFNFQGSLGTLNRKVLLSIPERK
jgi:iron complex outermembrane receptor protein